MTKIIQRNLCKAIPMAEPSNTLEATRKLQQAGCGQALAEEMASQINGAVTDTVATKTDVELLQSDIKR
ncbi:MAG: hypothetical protein OXC80_03925 [Gammaproteobacteria bacterium]|nr:hypothetical protein [Gammaproteobacteria bacterium]